MQIDCITFQNSGYFSSLIIDYLNEKTSLKSFYNRFPNIENFKEQILEKSKNFNEIDYTKRTVLVQALENQYQGLDASELTKQNITSLFNDNTFTITTGHQLNLFTGPLYFLYKIVSTINLCSELKKKYPNQNFVPIYWMATEDHDFDEISYFNFKGKKFRWNVSSSGPVGQLSNEGLNEVFEIFSQELDSGKNANYIKGLFQKSYLKHKNLADATRFLANELFGKYGLVILDANTRNLKEIFAPYIKEELINQKSFTKINETISKLQDYKIQVNPREINLFYIMDNFRERILKENGIFKINNSKIEFTETEILLELKNFPERFSPNVTLRPLYQEIILPNLCYIGGGGEIAYWLELKSTFECHKITFPVLLLRNSAVIVNEKQVNKLKKLDLNWQDLFKKQNELLKFQTIKKSAFEIDFSSQKKLLQKQFEDLKLIANKTDKSFLGAVNAQESKQISGLENLEKRLLKAQKRVLTDDLSRIIQLQNELFPNNSLQERQANFSEFYIEYGEKLIQKLILELKPLQTEFNVITF